MKKQKFNTEKSRRERHYEICQTGFGWKLSLFQNNEQVGGGVGGPSDYHLLLDQALDFCYEETV